MHDLPRVSIETVHSAAASTDDDPEFINSTLEKMKTENPLLSLSFGPMYTFLSTHL